MKSTTKAIINIIAIIFILLLSNQFAKSQTKADTLKVFIVQSGKTVLKLNRGDLSYLKRVCRYKPLLKALKSNTGLKNNDLSDMAIVYMNAKKK